MVADTCWRTWSARVAAAALAPSFATRIAASRFPNSSQSIGYCTRTSYSGGPDGLAALIECRPNGCNTVSTVTCGLGSSVAVHTSARAWLTSSLELLITRFCSRHSSIALPSGITDARDDGWCEAYATRAHRRRRKRRRPGILHVSVHERAKFRRVKRAFLRRARPEP